MLVRRVVRDDVDDDPDAVLVGLAQQLAGIRERAEHRVDVAVVSDVIARRRASARDTRA